MAQKFFPIPEKQKRIPASFPHINAEYVVSIGTEIWDGVAREVIKVQMAYDGKVSGRLCPSYPMGTDDYKRVNEAIQELLSR